jgi:GT2 family glycosyltransferase
MIEKHEYEFPVLDISVVTYNSSRWLESFFISLESQNYPLDCISLLLRDNGSTDSTSEDLKRFQQQKAPLFAEIVLDRGGNIGFGQGHNSNLVKAKAEYFLVTNVDLEFEKNTLITLVKTAIADDINVAGWECRQKPYEHPKNYHPATLEVSWSSSACMLFRRSVLQKIGGYEPKLFLYGEDVELSFRLRDRGYKLRYIPKATCWHYTYESESEIKPVQMFGSTLANCLLRLRYGRWYEVLAVLPMYAGLLMLPAKVEGQRKAIIYNGLKLLKLAPYFLSTRKKSEIHFPFRLWDYEFIRDGAFYKYGYSFNDRPLVSILVRTIEGRSGRLKEAVNSVLNQTYSPIELVIVEDGSSTATQYVDEIRSLERLEKIIYQPLLKKVGRCIAGNTAMNMATGAFFCFLDDDDLFYADHVEVLVTELHKKPEIGAAYGLAFEVKTNVISTEPWVYQEVSYDIVHRQTFSKAVLWHHNFMPIQAVLFRRQLYEEYGGFDPELDNLEDWELWVRYTQKRDFYLVKKTTSLYRIPACPENAVNRQKILDNYYEKAKNKQKNIKITLTPIDIVCLADEIVRSTHIAGILPHSMLKRFVLKVPFLGRFYHILRKIGTHFRNR